MSKKLRKISKSSDNTVTFYFNDYTTLKCTIDGNESSSFLFNPEGHNADVFYQLGITDPHSLYKKLGIYTLDGECPECRRKDLDKVFDYLLEHYSEDIEEPKEEPKQPSEWDWLLD